MKQGESILKHGTAAVLAALALVATAAPAQAASEQHCQAFPVLGGSDAVCSRISFTRQRDDDLTIYGLAIFAAYGNRLEDCPAITARWRVYAGKGDNRRILSYGTRKVCKDGDGSVDTYVTISEKTGRKRGTVVIRWTGHADYGIRDRSGSRTYVFG